MIIINQVGNIIKSIKFIDCIGEAEGLRVQRPASRILLSKLRFVFFFFFPNITPKGNSFSQL